MDAYKLSFTLTLMMICGVTPLSAQYIYADNSINLNTDLPKTLVNKTSELVESSFKNIGFELDSTDSSINSIVDSRQVDSIVSNIITNTLIQIYTEELIKERNGTIGKHIVERGEDWERIATLYGIDASLLQSLNPSEQLCITGIELNVPIFNRPKIDHSIYNYSQREIEKAENYEKSGEWKKAIKIYSDLLKQQNSIEIRYYRGRAYYRNKKLKESAKDFEYVVKHDEENLFPDARDVYAQVSAEWEDKKQQRAEMWGNIIGGLLKTGLEVADICLNKKYGTTSSNNFLMSSGSSTYSVPAPAFTGVPGSSTSNSGSYYTNGIQIPPSLDIRNYFTPETTKIEITYDQWGNPMYSSPNFANAIMRMQQDFNAEMSNSPTLFNGSATSNALLSLMNINNQQVSTNAYLLSTPSYFTPFDQSSTETTSDHNNPGSSFNSSGNTNYSNKISHTKCVYCKGTGYKVVEQSGIATLGTTTIKKKCPICNKVWDPAIEIHKCVKCNNCDYWQTY